MSWYHVVVGGHASGKEPRDMSRIQPTHQENVEQMARWSRPKKGHRHSVVSTAGPNADNWAAILDALAWSVDNDRANREELDDEFDF